jgi:hypothetical protein
VGRVRTERAIRSEEGQAAVETVATLPLVALVGALVWQLALTGHAAWLCGNAARAAARAEAVGKDGGVAARAALPRSLERGLRVRRDAAGAVRVELRVPLVLGGRRSPLRVAARARLDAGRP